LSTKFQIENNDGKIVQNPRTIEHLLIGRITSFDSLEQKKIETKLAETARFYDNDSLRTLFEPIGESMMGIIGLDLPSPRKKEQENNR
jgi:hypothetical protein